MNRALSMFVAGLLALLCDVSADAQVEQHADAPRRFGLADPSWFLAGFGSEKNGKTNDLFTDSHNQMKFRFVLQAQVIPFGKNADGIYASFTQSSFWDPYTKNSPALENTYTPEVFVYWDNGYAKLGNAWSWSKPSVRISYTHQSNGLGGEASRTWNRAILRIEFGDLTNHPLLMRLSVWVPFNDMDNPDIEDHLGWGDVAVNWQPLLQRYPDGMRVLGVHAETNWGVSGRILKRFQLDIFAHPVLLDSRLAWMPTLMLQYFTGRGESIRLYNRDTRALRVGVVLFP
ncbi:MAG: phospholipase A [bacterium]